MKKFLLGILAITMLLSSTKGYTQENFSMDNSKVSQYEVSMTEYEKDKDAEALVIFEKGENFFFYQNLEGFKLMMKYRIKIKILKQAGIEYANFEIPYYTEGNSWEEVIDIEGVTYNYEGNSPQQTLLQPSNIFTEKASKDTQRKKFTMPNVKVGSVIEVSYTHITPYFHRMKEWEFQKKIPVVFSNLEYRATPFFEYSYILKGTNKFDSFTSEVSNSKQTLGNTTYSEVIFNFGMKDLSAFKDEEFITSPRDYMVSLNLQLSKINSDRGVSKEFLSTWPKICDILLDQDAFGKYLKNSQKEAKKILPSLNLEGKSQTEQVKIITEYVKSNYSWDSNTGKFAYTEKLSDFLKNKTGNSGNLNLFLIGLLQGAGMDANPLVLSTRGNGIISKDHPFESFLNYVIAQINIDGKDVFLDATEPLLHYDELPIRCINVDGLVVRKNQKPEKWFFIEQETLSSTHKKLNITIDPSQSTMNIDAEFVSEGFDAYNYRKTYQSENYNLKDFLKRTRNIDVIGDVSFKNFEDKDKPFIFDFESKTLVETNANKIFIAPFCGLSPTDNLFKQANRTLLVDLVVLMGDSYESEIEIPAGYKVEYTPKDVVRDTPFMSISYQTKIEGNKIYVNGSYKLKSSIYKANAYDPLKYIYASTIDKFSEKIVLVKE